MTREERSRASAGSCPSGVARRDAQVVPPTCYARTKQRRALKLPSLEHTKLHGLRYICSPRLAFQRRAFWFLAFFTSLGLLLSWSSNRLLYWLSFPSHTRVQLEWSKELVFPAVTLCNNNPVRFHKLGKSDLYFAGYWLGLLLANRTARPLLAELLPEDKHKWFHKLADFRLFLPPRDFDGISVGFMDRLGHQLEEMLLSCRYRGETCGPHNFSTVSAFFLTAFFFTFYFVLWLFAVLGYIQRSLLE